MQARVNSGHVLQGVNVKVWLTAAPANFTVIVTTVVLVTALVEIGNEAAVLPEVTVTVEGTVTSALLEEIETT